NNVKTLFCRHYRVHYLLQICYLLALVCLMLHILDRQIEYTSRTDFLWQNKLKIEQDEVETMRGINKILLENILPAHVAEHFLTNVRATQDLYHERYSSIAVMFASIPNYKEFYDETDINKQGLECLRLLNEIICDFDKLLLKPKFSGIEKIKTIGSTYMLASGLNPGKKDTNEEELSKQQDYNIIILVEFALALMTILDQINKESFQQFKLRIGHCHFFKLLDEFILVPGIEIFRRYLEGKFNKSRLIQSRLIINKNIDEIRIMMNMQSSAHLYLYDIEVVQNVKGRAVVTFQGRCYYESLFQIIHKFLNREKVCHDVNQIDMIGMFKFSPQISSAESGLNHGPVIAGVVGAQKPQYDIWGNTVNVASRMDSCGEMGKLQVTENTAKILIAAGYELTCRGPIYVKGKGTLITYFVKTPYDEKEKNS
ncbi:unnamed protein product, partial [Heterotrigona itama]